MTTLQDPRMQRLIGEYPEFFPDSHPFVLECGLGWIGVIDKLCSDLPSAFGEDRSDRVWLKSAREKLGRLRMDYWQCDPDIATSRTIVRLLFLGECRSLYTCETCGKPGEFRKATTGWLAVRCAEHQTAEQRQGRLLYDAGKTPWREMPDGRWRYDVAGDALVRAD